MAPMKCSSLPVLFLTIFALAGQAYPQSYLHSSTNSVGSESPDDLRHELLLIGQSEARQDQIRVAFRILLEARMGTQPLGYEGEQQFRVSVARTASKLEETFKATDSVLKTARQQESLEFFLEDSREEFKRNKDFFDYFFRREIKVKAREASSSEFARNILYASLLLFLYDKDEWFSLRRKTHIWPLCRKFE